MAYKSVATASWCCAVWKKKRRSGVTPKGSSRRPNGEWYILNYSVAVGRGQYGEARELFEFAGLLDGVAEVLGAEGDAKAEEASQEDSQGQVQLYIGLGWNIRQGGGLGDGYIGDFLLIEQAAVAFLRGLHFFDEAGELLHVILVDLSHLLHQVRLVAVVRERVMAVGNAQLPVRTRGAFAGHKEGDNPRQVGLEGDRDHAGHQTEMLGEIGRDAVRFVHWRIDLPVVRLGTLDLALDFADGGEILVEFAPVGRPKVRFQLAGILGNEVEDAAPVFRLARTFRRRHRLARAEQPLKQRARVQSRRQGLRPAAPGEIVGVGAGIAGIAVTRLAGVIHAEFE